MDINDIKQGRHGDCFILASIISILYTLGENQIKNIIKDDTNSFYYFSFRCRKNNNGGLKSTYQQKNKTIIISYLTLMRCCCSSCSLCAFASRDASAASR